MMCTSLPLTSSTDDQRKLHYTYSAYIELIKLKWLMWHDSLHSKHHNSTKNERISLNIRCLNDVITNTLICVLLVVHFKWRNHVGYNNKIVVKIAERNSRLYVVGQCLFFFHFSYILSCLSQTLSLFMFVMRNVVSTTASNGSESAIFYFVHDVLLLLKRLYHIFFLYVYCHWALIKKNTVQYNECSGFSLLVRCTLISSTFATIVNKKWRAKMRHSSTIKTEPEMCF